MRTDDQIIYQKLGKLLWSVMSLENNNIILRGQVYADHQDLQLLSEIDQESIYMEIPTSLFLDLCELMAKLQKCLVFNKEPWTHFQILLTEKGGFKIDFAYISEKDSWFGLYMRGVGDLDQSELDEYNIPLKEWRKCVSAKK